MANKSLEVDSPTNNGDGSATSEPTTSAEISVPAEQSTPPEDPWPTFVSSAKSDQIKQRFAKDMLGFINGQGMDRYCVLALLEPSNSIDTTDLDQIFKALEEVNGDKGKDVLLLLLSRGGSIEPAYQISKLCKSFAKEKFVAVVPRQAKSAATLIALGADEIHMGPLGQLGPIDPQLDGLPALGVSQALKTIASVSQQFPGSAEMFARYLRLVLTVEQIGYCDRISESAVQYAQRLLSTKPTLQKGAEGIAKELVHEYKHHGFVIDFDEAKMHLGDHWVKTGTPELAFAETVYDHFDTVNFLLDIARQKRLIVTGGAALEDSVMIFSTKKK